MGLHIIPHDTRIDFIGMRKIAYLVSALLLLISAVSLVIKGGPRYGIDFSGGINVQIKFAQEVDLTTLRTALEHAGLAGVSVQNFGDQNDHAILARVGLASEDQTATLVREAIATSLHAALPDVSYEIQRLELVGPKVGADLREKALQAIFYAVLLIATYVSGRFEQRWMVSGIMAASLMAVVYVLELLHVPMSITVIAATIATLVLCLVLKLKYALGAMVGLIHDVMIPLGLFSLLNKEVDLTIIAAFLTIVGYSLNDTIIVYDRIRENLRTKSAPTLPEIINLAVNQTLSRTVITSFTTFIAVFALFVLGGGVIHDFALAMLVGIVIGTFSSIYVSAPVLLMANPRTDSEETPASA